MMFFHLRPSIPSIVKHQYITLPLASSRLYSSNMASQPDNQARQSNETANPEKKLALPLPPATGGAAQLPLGDSLKMTELGPMVINEDGSVSKVNNWKEMSEIERETFKRLILKRNQERLKKLRQQQPLVEERGNTVDE